MERTALTHSRSPTWVSKPSLCLAIVSAAEELKISSQHRRYFFCYNTLVAFPIVWPRCTLQAPGLSLSGTRWEWNSKLFVKGYSPVPLIPFCTKLAELVLQFGNCFTVGQTKLTAELHQPCLSNTWAWSSKRSAVSAHFSEMHRTALTCWHHRSKIAHFGGTHPAAAPSLCCHHLWGLTTW